MYCCVLNTSKDRDSTAFQGKLYQSSIPLGKVLFLYLNGISCISVCSHFFLSYHCAWQRRVWFCLPNFLPCINNNQMFIYVEKIPLSFCFSRLNSSISFSLSSYIMFSHPLIIFVVHPWTCSRIHTSLFTGKLRCRWITPDMTHQVWAEVKDHLPQTAAIAFLNAHHEACISFPYTKSNCCPKVKLVSTRTSRSFSAKLFSSQKCPYWGMGLLLPSGRINALPFAELSEIPISPFLQTVKVPLVHQLLL